MFSSWSRLAPGGNAGSRQDARALQPTCDGDTMHLEDGRSVQRAVEQIQQHAADIRKEAGMLGIAASPGSSGARSRVQEHVEAATLAAGDARRLLERPGGITGLVLPSEQHARDLTQQKLEDTLAGATKALELARGDFEAADRAYASRGASNPTDEPDRRSAAGAELYSTEPQQQLQQRAITDAEVELHAQIVSETTDQMANLTQSFRSLQRAMVDLAEHTQAQGETLESIETHVARSMEDTGNATELLADASQRQQQSNRWLFWLLLFAFVLAIIVMVTVWQHSRRHHR